MILRVKIVKGRLFHQFFLKHVLQKFNRDIIPKNKLMLMSVPEELCQPSPCGTNTKCEVINNTPTCTCLPGYVGSPLSGCRHECDSDYDCPSSQSCQNFKCISACTNGVCAPTANCVVNNHRAVCSCPPVRMSTISQSSFFLK